MEEVAESGIPTFGEFRKESKNILIEESEEKEIENEDSNDLLDQIKGSIETPLDDKDPDDKSTHHDEKKMVNLIIGDFQPFNNGDLKIIQRTKQENHLPVVLAVVEPQEGSSKYPLDSDMLRKSMVSVATEFKDMIEDVIYIKDNLLATAIDALSEKYNVVGLTTQKENFENYVLQKKSLIKKGKLEAEFHVYSTPQWSNSTEIRELINRQDFVNFKKNAPKSIVYLWQELIKFA